MLVVEKQRWSHSFVHLYLLQRIQLTKSNQYLFMNSILHFHSSCPDRVECPSAVSPYSCRNHGKITSIDCNMLCFFPGVRLLSWKDAHFVMTYRSDSFRELGLCKYD